VRVAVTVFRTRSSHSSCWRGGADIFSEARFGEGLKAIDAVARTLV
jgi:hypothetical protein